ncbi:hypothetical protein [Segetibacter aerophilus]|uniref:Uncharacterized protein n=1 Tax=Segetibacter aerophilus TaxID=670293 RepID=A0A512BIM7_9BACT|nr:hypothetical protein [Segetibacter aerophilus]GEO11811.1 hypothetical protein SAE01_43070 [Segetibacter aerophilus]
MEPLFEAKALYENEYVLYNIYRIERERYKAELIVNDDEEDKTTAPKELFVTKKNGKWHIEDSTFNELGLTLGIEIDAFNNGYGALLGRIGVT